MTTPNAKPLVFKTGRTIMLVGLWFLVLGLTLSAAPVAAAIFIIPQAPLWLRVLFCVFAATFLPFAGFGLLLTLGGQRITLDAATGQVHICYGRWWIWKREMCRLDDFHLVEVFRPATRPITKRAGGAEGMPTYTVRLLSGDNEVELANVSSYRKARTIAEKVANFTALSLHEATEPETVVREAGTLDESLAQRARRLGENVQWPELPENSRIEVQAWGEETILDLPRPNRKMILKGVLGVGFLLLTYGVGLVPATSVVRYCLQYFGIDANEGVWPVVVWSVAIIPLVYILGFGIVLLIGHERVAVSPRIFKRIWRLPVGAWTRRIPVGQIEELLTRGEDEDGAVILRTDRRTCRVGFASNKKERRWLREAIRYLLVKGPR